MTSTGCVLRVTTISAGLYACGLHMFGTSLCFALESVYEGSPRGGPVCTRNPSENPREMVVGIFEDIVFILKSN